MAESTSPIQLMHQEPCLSICKSCSHRHHSALGAKLLLTGHPPRHTVQYDDKLLDFFGIDRTKVKLPKIVPSSSPDEFGSIRSGILEGVRIAGCLGDQSSALVGQQGFTPGSAKNTYGTGCFLLYNVGEKPVISSHGLLATIAYDFGGKRKPVYALEGSIAVAGSGVKFLMNNMGFITHSHKISDLAASVEDNGGCVFVTAFSGLFAPYWIDDAKGTIFGITQFTERGHIARATLEATCFQTRAILDAMELDSGHKLNMLAVDGGMSNSNLCMQVRNPMTRPTEGLCLFDLLTLLNRLRPTLSVSR